MCPREDFISANHIRQGDGDLAVEPPGAREGLVQDVRSVGRPNDHHPVRGAKAIHLGQQLREGCGAIGFQATATLLHH